MITSSVLLGVLVTALVQWLKNAFKTDKVGTLAIVAVLSFILAIGAWVLAHFNLLETFLAIVASATTIYAFVVQHMEDAS